MKIAVTGLGYVGLSNAAILAQHNEIVLEDEICQALASEGWIYEPHTAKGRRSVRGLRLNEVFNIERRLRQERLMARQGPIAGTGGDQPGIRPRRLQRCHRSCWCFTRFVFQRGRGRFRFSSSASDRKAMTSSFWA